MKAILGISVLWLTAGLSASPAPADVTRIVIENEGPDVREAATRVPLDGNHEAKAYRLVDLKNHEAGAAEIYEEGGRSWIAVNLRRLTAGKSEFLLLPPGPPVVAMELKGKDMAILVDGGLLTTYAVDLGPKPILYPLVGPSGARMTRDYPMEQRAGEHRDHEHHRSVWFTHGEVNDVDFWTEAPGHGSIFESSRQILGSGHAVKVLETSDNWLGPDGKKVCEDRRTLRVYGTHGARILDYEVTLVASEGPVVMGDTKEGTFGVRVPSSMDANRPDGGRIVNAEGVTNTDTWGKRSAWVDYAGPVNGDTVGIAILDHPESFNHPTPWHVRDYGLFAANPFGLQDFGESRSGETTIPKGEFLTFRYRVILHLGDAMQAEIASQFESYARPPKITLVEP